MYGCKTILRRGMLKPKVYWEIRPFYFIFGAVSTSKK